MYNPEDHNLNIGGNHTDENYLELTKGLRLMGAQAVIPFIVGIYLMYEFIRSTLMKFVIQPVAEVDATR